MLLVLLISLVVSAATAVATLSVVHQRIAVSPDGAPQPTIIQQTVNRIIERSSVPTAGTAGVPEEQPSPNTAAVPHTVRMITLADMRESMVKVYHGSVFITAGMFVSSDGMLIAARRLDRNKRYGIRPRSDDGGGGVVQFTVANTTDGYSLLKPVEEHTPAGHIPTGSSPQAVIGHSALIYGGFDDAARLHSEIISQRETVGDDAVRIRTSVSIGDAAVPSAVFVDNLFIGFMTDTTGWVYVFGDDFLSADTEE